MGFKLNINNILRYELKEELKVGGEYQFEKDELCVLADDIQIWLTKKDWTAIADIQVIAQQRKDGKTTGSFIVKHIYQGQEQEQLTTVFRRMYGWK